MPRKFQPSTEADLGGFQDWWEGKEGAIPDFIPFIGTREKAAETQASMGVPEEERVKPYEKPEPEPEPESEPSAEQPKPEKQPFHKQPWFVPTVVITVGAIATASILWAGRSTGASLLNPNARRHVTRMTASELRKAARAGSTAPWLAKAARAELRSRGLSPSKKSAPRKDEAKAARLSIYKKKSLKELWDAFDQIYTSRHGGLSRLGPRDWYNEAKKLHEQEKLTDLQMERVGAVHFSVNVAHESWPEAKARLGPGWR